MSGMTKRQANDLASRLWMLEPNKDKLPERHKVWHESVRAVADIAVPKIWREDFLSNCGWKERQPK